MSPTRDAPSRTPVWIAAGTTGGLVVGAVVFGVLTVESNSTLNGQLNQFPGSASAISSTRSQVHAYALVSDVLGGAALAGLGVTVYLGVSRRSPAPVRVGFAPASAHLDWAF